MAVVLLILSMIAGAFGGFVVSHAQTVFTEIEGLVLWVVAAILFSGAFIVNAVDRCRTKTVTALRELGKQMERGRARQGAAQEWPTVVDG
jgi:hypothetical protein